MAHVKIETSARTHPKLLAAGPAAAWLWVCGLLYCQDALTDGHIPASVVPFLGVPKPEPLVAKLVAARLWERAEGGYQVHDYLAHNRSADAIRAMKATNQRNGHRGGRPTKNESLTESVTESVSHPVTESLTESLTHTKTDAVVVSVAVSDSGFGKEKGRPLDSEFSAFVEAYPAQGRAIGYRAATAFQQARAAELRQSTTVYADSGDALEARSR